MDYGFSDRRNKRKSKLKEKKKHPYKKGGALRSMEFGKVGKEKKD
jgi:hypothetical protein